MLGTSASPPSLAIPLAAGGRWRKGRSFAGSPSGRSVRDISSTSGRPGARYPRGEVRQAARAWMDGPLIHVWCSEAPRDTLSLHWRARETRGKACLRTGAFHLDIWPCACIGQPTWRSGCRRHCREQQPVIRVALGAFSWHSATRSPPSRVTCLRLHERQAASEGCCCRLLTVTADQYYGTT